MGDNGGTSTIVKSANTLVDLGHDVYIVDSGKNKHTWTPLKAKHMIKTLPDADAIIATGYKSASTTISAPERCGIKCHWIRAWEHWQMSDQQIVDKVLKQPTIKLVNSICLRNKLQEYGYDSHIVRPGYDFGYIFPLGLRNPKCPPVLGGLFRAGIHGKRKRTEWVLRAASKIKKSLDGARLFMFGSEPNPNNPVIDQYLRRPNMKQKCRFYNTVDIWLAPTMSEGLHLPPAEAMMTKCPVVGTTAPLSGMQDYLIDNETGIVTDDNMSSFIYGIMKFIKDINFRNQCGENAGNKMLQLGDRETNMKKLIKILENPNV